MAAPIYEAANKVNTNACINATMSSIAIMKIVNNVESIDPMTPPVKFWPDSPNMNIKLMKLKIAM